jgi:hypothetical protein
MGHTAGHGGQKRWRLSDSGEASGWGEGEGISGGYMNQKTNGIFVIF